MLGDLFADVRRFPSIDSTNRYLLDEARAGAPEGVVAIADHQTSGRGRLGRRWEAPAGTNLLASVLLRPDLRVEERHLASAVVSLAGRQAARQIAGVTLRGQVAERPGGARRSQGGGHPRRSRPARGDRDRGRIGERRLGQRRLHGGRPASETSRSRRRDRHERQLARRPSRPSRRTRRTALLPAAAGRSRRRSLRLCSRPSSPRCEPRVSELATSGRAAVARLLRPRGACSTSAPGCGSNCPASPSKGLRWA